MSFLLYPLQDSSLSLISISIILSLLLYFLQRCTVTLKRHKYNKTYDIIGGRDSNNVCYIFSDGVGKVSKEFAEKIAMDVGLGSSVPSCYQVYFDWTISFRSNQ